MNFHESPDFKDAILATAKAMSIRPVFVEKDYWVTYALKNLSNSPYSKKIVFKGGTSLSKAYKCINRYSEDIDLAMLNDEGYNDNKLKPIIKEVEEIVSQGLTPLPGHPKEMKRGRNRTTIYEYKKVLPDTDFGAANEKVQLEINSFTHPVPHQVLMIQSYIGEFLSNTRKQEDVEKYQLQPFPLQVLSMERTFFEKLLSLNRLSYMGIDPLKEKIRHFYDLHQLYHHPGMEGKMLDKSKFEILSLAIEDDKGNATFAGEWIGKPLSQSPLFSKLEETWKSLIPTYQSELGDLVWKDLPKPNAILEVMEKIREFVKEYDAKK